MLLDIHSHILPAVDDGAKNLEASITLLKMMKDQGITDVIATPHFYPNEDTLEEFKARVADAYKLLKTTNEELPNIIIGCELFYYSGVSQSELIKEFTLGDSNYILLEPSPYLINRSLMREITYLRDVANLTPIIPHIERYHKTPGFKDFIKFIKENKILCQVNASSFFDKSYNRVLKKLFKEGSVTFIATDTHSLNRPPLLAAALDEIEKRFSASERQRLLTNLNTLFEEITCKDKNNEIEYAEYL